MKQPSLDFDPPSVPSTTSQDAATAIAGRAPALRRLVLETIRASADGMTREEIEDATGLTGNTVRPRAWELLKAGLIIETTATRRTRSGRAAFVLRAI